jgi:hypothetical protein
MHSSGERFGRGPADQSRSEKSAKNRRKSTRSDEVRRFFSHFSEVFLAFFGGHATFFQDLTVLEIRALSKESHALAKSHYKKLDAVLKILDNIL